VDGLAALDLGELSPERLESLFDATEPLTVGIEEELLLLAPDDLDLAPRAQELIDRLDGDQRFKRELPAAQLEIVTAPAKRAADAVDALLQGRRDLAAAGAGLVRPAGIGLHPFAAAEGELSDLDRYEWTRREYACIARRQLVSALQVHVAVGGAERTRCVYNALREYLPEIAALAANARFHEGRDTGMASMRPKIAENLPRQGLPPPIESWSSLLAELRWGVRSGAMTAAGQWWWEVRPHLAFGTIEVRVPDTQTLIAEAAAVVAFVQSLVAWLAQRHDRSDLPPDPVPSWRIEQNRWSAARHGVEGQMADLRSGAPEPTRERLGRLLQELAPSAKGLGCTQLLACAERLVERNGAIRQRELGESGGPEEVARWCVEHFLDEEGLPGPGLSASVPGNGSA
jgi:carboxylate-amine ligase